MRREEKVVRQKENRDMARDAMRSLFKVARAKVESGVGGDLPLDDMQDAKEYFIYWKRTRLHENNKMIFFAITAALLFLFHPQGIDEGAALAGGIGMVWAFYFFLEWDKRKRVYVSEMLGDLSHLHPSDAAFYVDGLLYDLWRIEKEQPRWILALVSFLFVAGSAIALSLVGDDRRLHGMAVSVGMMASIIFFSQDIIMVKKISPRDAAKKEEE